MTQHSKITLPKDGASLFERAEEAFGERIGSSAFTPAPVPKNLAKPVNRPVNRNVKRPVEGAAVFTTAPRAEVPAAPVVKTAAPAAEPLAPVATAPIAVSAPKTRAVDPVVFPVEIHKINRAKLRQHGLIEPEAEISSLMEEFRIVRRQVLQSIRAAQKAGKHGKSQRILICSPLPDEGKTFCATNLALAMAAEKDGDVLLVDADFAKPSILGLLGLPKSDGLMDALANPDINVEDCVIRTDIPGLSVLPAGNRTLTDSEFLASSRTSEVFSRLTQGAPNRVVIFDSPPALAASPAADLASHVGQALVVARADKTGQNAMEDALTLLSSCPDIKLLLNAANFSPSGRRFGSYYGYGR